ncbi:MAG TPA: hypothetical protein VEW42_00460 [Candidatus Eisenbacteria bacterium]|nr:hypothetical protein [Candidatus Eisenbacteria bacterium]
MNLSILPTNRWFLLAIILISAGVFRLFYIQYIEFKSDEALNILLATRPLFHHPFAPASLASSAGILNFPLLNYLLFPIVIFSTYPPTISFVIAVINVAAIGGYFLLFSKYHGKLIAFLASTMIALSPWAILYSRKIWAQDFLLPMSFPFFFSVYKILEGKKRYWLLFGISSLLLLQIHQLAVLLPASVFVTLLIKRKRPFWRILILGILIGIIPAIPYFLYQVTTYCASCQNSVSFFARFSFHDLAIFLRPLQILSIGNFHTELGNDFAIFASEYHMPYLISKITYLAYILIPIGAFLFWKKEKLYGFFASICISMLFLYYILGIEPLMHYYIFFIPFLALFLVYPLYYLLKNFRLRIVGILVCLAFFTGLILFDYSFFSLLSRRGGLSGEYGSGFISGERERENQVVQYKNLGNYNEILIASYTSGGWLKGYMPVGKMLFPHNELEKNSISLEKSFEKDPQNPLLDLQVTALLTNNLPPTWQDVLNLRTKADAKPVYVNIYKSVLDEYLSSYYKGLYESPQLLLLYPKHWIKTVSNNTTLLASEETILSIESSKQPPIQPILEGTTQEISTISIKNEHMTKIDYRDITGVWYETFYGPIDIGGRYFAFYLKPTSLKTANEESRIAGDKITQEILISATNLSQQ